MSLRSQLYDNPSLKFRNNIFYQDGIQHQDVFQESYLKLRKKEKRIHDDSVVQKLPDVERSHPSRKEWEMRKSTVKALSGYLIRSGAKALLEVGCGNGWLSHNLAAILNIEICALDVNEPELIQGARVFKSFENLSFIYADIFTPILKEIKFDVIVVAGSVQYFPDLQRLITVLLHLIEPSGQIYIADSPFYDSTSEANDARQRSRDHFTAMGCVEMSDLYFHHTYDELGQFKYRTLYDPYSVHALIKRKLFRTPLSVFPLICVTSS